MLRTVGFHSSTWLLIAALAAAPAIAQPYGRTAAEPVGAYLGGTFPSRTPGTAGAWAVENAFPNLTFRDPLQMLELPGENKFIMIGKAGEVWVFDDDPATTTKTLVLDIVDAVLAQPDAGLLGIALHPQFDQPGAAGERSLFLHYRYTPDPLHTNPDGYVRLSRFTINTAMDWIDPASESVLIQQYDRSDWHNGGGLFFGADGFLYVSVGDEGGSDEEYNSAQKLDGGLFSGALRLDVDQDPAKSHPIRRQPVDAQAPPPGWPASFTQGYFIPDDNPWLDPGGTILEEFWAVGLRSPHRMNQDPVTGEIWVGDVGQGAREEISIVYAGANLQWPYREGFTSGPKAMPSPLIGIDQPPEYDYPRGVGSCIIGGFVYRGTKWDLELGGKYLFGDHAVRNVWTLTPGSDPSQVDFVVNIPPGGSGGKNGISSFATDSAGEVYVLKLEGTDLDGGIVYKLVQSSPFPDPPALLSQLGAFDDPATLDPAAGFIPYDVASPLWSDEALKQRWVAIPNDGSHDADAERVLARSYGDWKFSPGTVFVKHFELPLDANDPLQQARLETRFLVIDEDGESYGLTYRWDPTGTDATLLTGGQTGQFTVYDEQGAPSQRTWGFPSRTDCATCHNAAAGWVRGVNAHQLNVDFTYPDSGVTDNQLRTWNQLGILRPALREPDIAELPFAVSVDRGGYDRAHRVRSYLDANCAQCHGPGGANALFDARFDVPLAMQALVDGPLVGTYAVPDAAVIKPQNEAASILLQRVSSTAVDRMPPLATNLVHDGAVVLVTTWIQELTASTPLCDNLELAIPQSGWSLVYTDSEEPSEWPAIYAFDGDLETMWHTQWMEASPSHPHELQIDLGAHYDLSGLTHVPRQDDSLNGATTSYDIYVSDDTADWGSPVASGTFPSDVAESRVVFDAAGRYLRFVANAAIGGHPSASLAELNVLKKPCQTGCTTPGQVTDLTLFEDSGDTNLSWTPGGGTGVEFDIVRSADPADFDAPHCVETRDVDAVAIETDAPDPGEVFYYLVRPVNGCNGATFSAGVDSLSVPRRPGLCSI